MKKDCKLFLYITLAFCLMIVPCKNICAADQGWYSQNGKVFYQLDGEKAKGLVTIKGSLFYFDPNTGERLSGWRTVKGKLYYFGKNGLALTGKQKIGKYQYYFNRKGILQKDTLIQRTYYAGKRGRLASGWIHYGVNDYYFDPVTFRMYKGWHEIKGKYYYFNAYGQLVKGRMVGKTWYVNESGERQYGWVDAGTKRYYLDPDTGKTVKKGWNVINKQKFYFLEDHSLARNYWLNENQYLDEKGKLATGWQQIDGKTYYFRKGKKEKATGWLRISGKVYYFDEKGACQKLSGLVRTDYGIRYYFDPTTGEMATGWIHYGVNDYYFDQKTGRAYKGWHYIEGKRYFFNAFGQLAKNRFVGNTYFVDAEGKMVTDTWILSYEIGADGKKTGKTRTPGLFSENGKTWLLDENYEKLTGWREVDGQWYHFDEASGEMDREKWIDGYYLKKDGTRTSGQMAWIDGETYLFLEDGSKAKGFTEYEGKKYYFSTVTGALYTGFKVIDEYTYYFDLKQSGAMAVDTEISIDGMIYLFDKDGHMKPKMPDSGKEELGEQIAAYAQEFIGYPYKERGDQDLKQGVDCSGFTMLIMRHFGIHIPRTTWAQHDGVKGYKQPIQIPIEDRKPGDLIFYYSGNSHVGIYIGNDKVVHASNSAPYPKGGIKISSYDYVYIYGCVRYWY